VTDPGETEAIRRILLGICEKWRAEEEDPSSFSRSEKDPELITETILLSPKGGTGNSSIPSPGIPSEDQGMAETVIVSRDQWEGNLPKKTAAKPVGEDFLAETVILERGRKTGNDGRGE
jgi:hypothetical protein